MDSRGGAAGAGVEGLQRRRKKKALGVNWRCGAESNRRIGLLQSPALPLGYRTEKGVVMYEGGEKGFKCQNEKILRERNYANRIKGSVSTTF